MLAIFENGVALALESTEVRTRRAHTHSHSSTSQALLSRRGMTKKYATANPSRGNNEDWSAPLLQNGPIAGGVRGYAPIAARQLSQDHCQWSWTVNLSTRQSCCCRCLHTTSLSCKYLLYQQVAAICIRWRSRPIYVFRFIPRFRWRYHSFAHTLFGYLI